MFQIELSGQNPLFEATLSIEGLQLMITLVINYLEINFIINCLTGKQNKTKQKNA